MIIPRKVFYVISFLFAAALFLPGEAISQRRLVRVLVATPYIQNEAYQAVADVFAGSIIRELKRAGGMEIIPREEAEKYIKSRGGIGWVANRTQAFDLGMAINAEIVIYTTLKKKFQYIFLYYCIS